MLLVIHNLPGHMQFPHIKELIKDKCGLTELILDNLISEGQCNRVTVGLADEGDAALLIQKINGLFLHGSQLYVEDLRQKKGSDQPYFLKQPSNDNQQQQTTNRQQTPQFQESNMNMMHYPGGISSLPPPSMGPMQMSYNNLPFYMTPVQNSSINYDKPSPLPSNPLQQVPYYQQDMSSYGYQQPNPENKWNQELITSYPEKPRPTASNVTDSYVPSMNKKRGNGKELRNYHNDNRVKSGPSSSYNDIPDRDRNRNPYKLDNRKNRSEMNFDQQEDRQRRYKQSPPRGNDRRGKKPIPKSNNDFEKPRRSRFDRSPPRDRYLPNDRFHSQSGRESGFDESEQQRDFDRRDNFRDFGEYDQRRTYHKYEQKNDGQDNFGTKRQRPNYSNKPPKIFSNDPNNSTFSKRKVNVKGQQAASARFNEIEIRGPPPKLAKFSNQGNHLQPPRFGQLDFAKPLDSNIKESDSGSMKTKLMTHNVYRNKASSQLARQVISNARIGKINNFKQVLNSLQKCIASRIDVILGDKIAASLEEVMDNYRKKFRVYDDVDFFAAVVEKLERDKEDSARQTPGSDRNSENSSPGKPPKGPNKTANIEQPSTSVAFDPLKSNYYNKIKAKQGLGKDPEQNVQNVPGGQEPRLPKYPNASKDAFKVQKRTTKLEYQKDIYGMDKTLESALEAELLELKKKFKSGCVKPADTDEKNIRHRLITETVEEFLKVTQLHLKKRLLNISNNLVIRIFCSPKPPRRELMDAALKDMGIESLRKSERKRVFIATCNGFESYDRILAQQMMIIGDLTLKFKPLHLVGPPIRKHSKEAKELKSEVRELTEVDLDNGGESDGFEFDDDDNEANQSENYFDESDEKPDESDKKPDDSDKKPDESDKKIDDTKNKSDEIHTKPYESYNLDEYYGDADGFNDSDIVFVENKDDVMVIDDNEQFVDDVDISVGAVASKEMAAIAINFEDTQATDDKMSESIIQKTVECKDIATDEQNIEKTDSVAQDPNDLPEIVATDIAEDDLEDF